MPEKEDDGFLGKLARWRAERKKKPKDETGIDKARPWDSPVLQKKKPAEPLDFSAVDRAMEQAYENGRVPLSVAEQLDKRNRKLAEKYGEGKKRGVKKALSEE